MKPEALKALKISEAALKVSAHRLAQKGRIVSPRRGFFVIVPLEYKSAGSLPAEWFIHDLMAFHKQPYYVGLLSAAALHGASHQQPQNFHVVTNKPLRPTVVGRVSIQFFVRRHIGKIHTMQIKTPTGMIHVSTPEATAFDLVRYMDACGQVGNVATILREMMEKLTAKKLFKIAEQAEVSVVQRLGYILDDLGGKNLTTSMHEWLLKQHSVYIPLVSEAKPNRKKQKNAKWLVIVNEVIEVEV